MSVRTFPPAPRLNAAGTGEPPLGVSVTVDAVSVDAFIDVLNVTMTGALMEIPVAPVTGVMLSTSGVTRSAGCVVVVSGGGAIVVKLAVKLDASPTPLDPCAPVVTDNV